MEDVSRRTRVNGNNDEQLTRRIAKRIRSTQDRIDDARIATAEARRRVRDAHPPAAPAPAIDEEI